MWRERWGRFFVERTYFILLSATFGLVREFESSSVLKKRELSYVRLRIFMTHGGDAAWRNRLA